MLCTIVDYYLYDHSAAAASWTSRPVHFIRGYFAPLSTRSPVTIEIIKRILRVFFGVLFPVSIMHPDAIRRFEMVVLEGGKELIHHALFRPVAIEPAERDEYEDRNNYSSHGISAAAVNRGIVLLGIE